MAPNPSDLSLEITVALSSPAHRVEAMLAAWRERCPIYLAVLKPNAISLSTAKVS